MLMPSIDETCGDPELWLSYTEQAMAKLAHQNQIFGPVLTEIKNIYDEYKMVLCKCQIQGAEMSNSV